MRRDGRGWHGGRIFVCEDNLLMADVVCDFLRECGIQPVGPASRVQDALRMAWESQLDGALLDINLSGTPIFDVCPVLSRRGIPFIFLTGYGDVASSIIPVEYRAAPLITKPIEPEEMKEALAKMLGMNEGPAAPPPARRH
jgi:DNA-binding response OmpR family regulator